MNQMIKKPYILAFLPIGKNNDLISTFFANNGPNTGWHRLKLMFQKDEFGHLNTEHQLAIRNTLGAFFGFSTIGGINSSLHAWYTFKESNLQSRFLEHTRAKHNIQLTISSTFVRGALSTGLRAAFYSGLFSYTYIMISLYRGKSSLLEFLVAGYLAGAIWKTRYGLRGIILGGTVGSAIGAVIGTLNLIAMTHSGTRMENIIEMYYKPSTKFLEERKMNIRMQIEKEKSDILSKTTLGAEKSLTK